MFVDTRMDSFERPWSSKTHRNDFEKASTLQINLKQARMILKKADSPEVLLRPVGTIFFWKSGTPYGYIQKFTGTILTGGDTSWITRWNNFKKTRKTPNKYLKAR